MPKTEVQEALDQLVEVITRAVRERIQEVFLGSIPSAPASLGRPSVEVAQVRDTSPEVLAGARHYRTRVPCPVPGCDGIAAPVFRMVCKKHKGLSDKEKQRYKDLAAKRAA